MTEEETTKRSDFKGYKFRHSLIRLNVHPGSDNSIKFHEALYDTGNSDVFNSLFVKELIFYKWSEL